MPDVQLVASFGGTHKMMWMAKYGSGASSLTPEDLKLESRWTEIQQANQPLVLCYSITVEDHPGHSQPNAPREGLLPTGVVVHGPAAVATTEECSVQIGVRLLQGHAQVQEMVALLVQQHLQQQLHFLRAGRAVLVQLEAVELTEGARDDEQLDDSVGVRDGLHQVLVALVEQLFVLWLHCYARS